MKRSKKVFNREIAYNAFCYYTQNSDVNFSDTAAFISKLFGIHYTNDDIGKIFRHIVVFGNVDDTAKKLVHTINWRNKYASYVYDRFLGYRYEYPELLKELAEYEEIVYEKNQLKFLISEYSDFISSDEEKDLSLEELKKRYDRVCNSFDLLDFNYIYKLKENIKRIEDYRIKELSI